LRTLRHALVLALAFLALTTGARIQAQTGQISQEPVLVRTITSYAGGSTYYTGIEGGGPATTTESTLENYLGGSGNWALEGLLFAVENAPGAGQSITLTVRTGAYGALSNTSATLTISGTNTVATSPWTGNVTMTPGQWSSVSITGSASAANPGSFWFNTKRQCAGTSETLWQAHDTPAFSTSGSTTYCTANVGGSFTNEDSESTICPISGVVSDLRVGTTGVPGGATGIVVSLRLASQATPGTVLPFATKLLSCTVGPAATSASDLSGGHAISVTAGQSVDWLIDMTGAANTVGVSIAAIFSPADNASCMMLYGVPENASPTNVLNFDAAPLTTLALEYVQNAPLWACTIKSLYVVAETSACTNTGMANAETATMSIRTGSTSGALTTSALAKTITSTGTNVGTNIGSDTTHTVAVTTGQYLSQLFANTSASAVQFRWGYMLTMTQPSTLFRRTPANPRAGERGTLSLLLPEDFLCYAN
jgi:hypothetical protein